MKYIPLQFLVDCINNMLKNKFDCVIFIEGKRGLGKSTLAYKIAKRLDYPFKPKWDLVYTREDVINALARNKHRVIVADEMINVAYNRDFYEQDQKVLLKALNMYRDSYNVLIGCIPKFADLDNQIQRLCKIRFTVIRRGFALIHTQVPSIYRRDVWDMRNNEKVEMMWTNRGVKKPQYSKLSTVRGMIHFAKLPEKAQMRYDRIKQEKRNQVYLNYQQQQKEDEKSKSPDAVFYKNLYERIKSNCLTPQAFTEICLVAGKEKKTVRNRIVKYLHDENYPKKFDDLVAVSNVQFKRDILGFAKDS